MVAHHIAVGVVGWAGHASDGPGVGAGALEDGANQGGGAEGGKDEIENDAGADDAALFALKAVHGVVANEAFGLVDFDHDFVAGVHAGGAADALNLEPVANIDTGGADVDAAAAIDAVAFGFAFGSAGFATNLVIANDHGVVVGEDRLNTAVRAHDDAELFAEEGEAAVEDGGKESDDGKGGEVREGILMHESVEALEGHEVGEEDVGKEGGGEDVDAVFEDAFPSFFKRPWGGSELAAGGSIAVDEAFDTAEDVLQKDGVGAGPSAPETTKQGGNEKEGEAEARDEEEEDPEVLGSEGEAEEVKAALGDVEEDGWVAVDLNPRKGDVDEEHHGGDEAAQRVEFPADIGGVKHVVGAVIVDGGDGLEVGRFFNWLGHGCRWD